MGSTGTLHGGNSSGVNDRNTYGIDKAKVYSGNIPSGSGLEATGNGKITLRVASNEGQDIVFQFKLVDKGKMSIRAYDPNVPNKGKVSVVASRPSLDSVIKNGSRTDRLNAQKIREMMNRSSEINEGQLSKIAQDLQKSKNKRG